MEMSKEAVIELQKEFISRIRDPEDRSNLERINIAFNLYYTIRQHRNAVEVDVYELLNKADDVLRGKSYEVSEWCKAQCLPQNTLKDLKELDKYNVIKQDYDIVDLSLSDVYKTLSKKYTGKDIAEAAKTRYKATVERIKADVYNNYIKTRDRRNSDGSLDTFVNGDELEEINMLADEIVRVDPVIRSLNEANSNFTKIHDTMTERSINMKYKFEKLKEYYCNTLRVTPESFDEFYNAVRKEQETRMNTEIELSGDEKIPTLYGGVADLYNVDTMNDIVKKCAHLLKSAENDVDKNKPIYVSDILKVIEAIDEQDTARSRGNQLIKMTGYDDIWDRYNQLNQVNEVQSINRIQGKDLETGLNPNVNYKMTKNGVVESNKTLNVTVIKSSKKGWTFTPGVDNSKNVTNNTIRNTTKVQIDNNPAKIEEVKTKKSTSLDDLI